MIVVNNSAKKLIPRRGLMLKNQYHQIQIWFVNIE